MSGTLNLCGRGYYIYTSPTGSWIDAPRLASIFASGFQIPNLRSGHFDEFPPLEFSSCFRRRGVVSKISSITTTINVSRYKYAIVPRTKPRNQGDSSELVPDPFTDEASA